VASLEAALKQLQDEQNESQAALKQSQAALKASQLTQQDSQASQKESQAAQQESQAAQKEAQAAQQEAQAAQKGSQAAAVANFSSRPQISAAVFDLQRPSNHGTTNNQSSIDDKESLSALLTPPFRLVQVGEPRSGSTFQFHLLSTIAHMKTSTVDNIRHYNFDIDKMEQDIANNRSFVVKTHSDTPRVQQLHEEGALAVFSSGKITAMDYSHHQQEISSLVDCSACEIDKYRRLFGITDAETRVLKSHMSLYAKLRKCCGLEMSKFQVLRLHGCDVSDFVDKPGYPRCEYENMTDVELQFAESSLAYDINHKGRNWEKPGDCARFESIIRAGVFRATACNEMPSNNS